MCICSKFKDVDLIPISIAGMDIWDEFTKSFDDRTYTGDDRWWLYYMTCKECGTVWLVGQDERIHDNFCLYRFTQEDQLIFNGKGVWPNYFDKYESMLEIAISNGLTCEFPDHPNETFKETIQLVINDNPSIGKERLAELFNIDIETIKLYFK